MNIHKLTVVLICLLVGFATLGGLTSNRQLFADINISSSVNKSSVYVGESFTFSVTVSGDISNVPSPKLPDLGNFSVASRGSSSQISIVNNRVSSSKTYNYSLTPLKPGKFIIGSAIISFKGQEYKTNPINITVITGKPPAARRQQQQRRHPTTFDPFQQLQTKKEAPIEVRPSLSKKRIYVNEGVILTYSLYLSGNVGINRYGLEKPKTRDFWIEEIPMPKRPKAYFRTINGVRYKIFDLYKMQLFPTSPGNKTIGNAKFNFVVDSFFSFFGRTRTVSTPALTLVVKPLPDTGKPAGFKGAVGKYSISTEVDRKSMKQNEAFSYKVIISGKGNIKTITKPVLPDMSNFRIYQQTSRVSTDKTGGYLKGKKIYELTLMPMTAGKFRIRPAKFSFFDPGSKTYKTIRSLSITLDIESAGGPVATLPFLKKDLELIGKDIRFIKEDVKKLYSTNYSLTKPPVLFIIETTFLIALMLSIAYSYYERRLQADIKMARAGKALKKFRTGIGRIGRNADSNAGYDPVGDLERVVSNYIGDRFNISSVNIVLDELEKKMKKSGLDGKIVEKGKEFIEECRLLRFAPSSASVEDKINLIEKAKFFVNGIEKQRRR